MATPLFTSMTVISAANMDQPHEPDAGVATGRAASVFGAGGRSGSGGCRRVVPALPAARFVRLVQPLLKSSHGRHESVTPPRDRHDETVVSRVLAEDVA